MTNDFDAAIKYVESCCPSFSPRISDEDLNAIQFALRFTKAALSGEVSAGVLAAGKEYFDEQRDGSGFTAMCQQLAKEIG